METTTKTVTDNRDAKKSDAQTLADAYGLLVRAEKNLKGITREVKAAWIANDSASALVVARTRRTRMQEHMDEALDSAWASIIALPSGTTAPGGATPQTVALHFFNSGLNRNLKARLSSTEAKRLNKLSFGG